MFDDIGGKIKGLANFVCWAGIILSVIRAEFRHVASVVPYERH